MPRQEIGDFSGQYPTADMVDAGNIRGNTIFAQVIELAGGTKGVIRSQDFVSGSSGWSIFGNGAAEFSSVTLTGAITATSGEISGDLSVSGNLAVTLFSGDVITFGDRGGGAFMSIDVGNTYDGGMYTVTDDIAFYGATNDTDRGIITLKNNGGIELDAGDNLTHDVVITQGDLQMALGRFEAVDGSVSSPGYRFKDDTNTGMFRSGADDGRLVAGGSSIAQFTSGRFGPGSDNAIALGATGLRWTEVFAVNGTINTSDMRYKDELVDPVPGLSFVSKLHPFKYTWKSGDDHKVHWGLSAQQINALIGTEGPFREGEILGVSYMEIVPALVVAIQELEARLEDYANKLESLGS